MDAGGRATQGAVAGGWGEEGAVNANPGCMDSMWASAPIRQVLPLMRATKVTKETRPGHRRCAASRSPLAAESHRQAFLPHHPTSQESLMCTYLCRALETVLLAPGLRAEHGLPVHTLPRRGPLPQAVGHHCTDPNNRRGFPTCATAKRGQRESATIERAGQSETEFNNSIRSSVLGSVNEIVCYLRMQNISTIR